MSFLRSLWSMYRPAFATYLVYMLQSSEYQVKPYLAWLHRTKDFSRVMHRRHLVRTKASRLLLLTLRLGMLLQLSAAVLLLYWGIDGTVPGGVWLGIIIMLLYPYVWAYAVALPLLIGRELIVKPREERQIKEAEALFAAHPGVKLAIAGSYGKTTMKELLLTVLGEGKKVAATPANQNVAGSHARFAKTLTGQEDIVLIEYGEAKPGDVARFAAATHPTHGIITGVAPAHLDQYQSVQAAGDDIFSLATYLHDRQVYMNGEFTGATGFIHAGMEIYDRNGTLGWRVANVKLGIDGLDFTLRKGAKQLALHSGLLGRHQLGPLCLAAALAHQFGLSDAQIVKAVAATAPFEHRMQPYRLHGAWVIDDTYNGNLEGIRAGTALLAELPAKRKLYVTPGLVEQGTENERVHVEVGRLIAAACPDVVVLMRNSTTDYIRQGLEQAGYDGEVRLETDPLAFYTNLREFVATGDLVLLQNDWTDNYA